MYFDNFDTTMDGVCTCIPHACRFGFCRPIPTPEEKGKEKIAEKGLNVFDCIFIYSEESYGGCFY